MLDNLYYKALNYININNLSNNLPYHGIDHLYSVFESSYNSIQKIKVRFYFDLLKYEKELLIASLFHDYNHSGGKLPDSENIINAIKGLTEFHSLNNEFDLEYASYLIKCTEYPYVVNENELTLEAQIIRDADMCYQFQDLSIVKLYQGLRVEFNKTLPEFLDNQLKFTENLKFYLDFNNLEWNKIKHKRINEIKKLQENL